jgi:uncharacterized protein (DUF433 family)
MAVINIQHIAQRAGFLGGKPYIADTRISIQQVAVLHTKHDWSVEQIAEQHDLSPAQIHAALSYYYDHKPEIDASIVADDELAKQVGSPVSELRTSKKS